MLKIPLPDPFSWPLMLAHIARSPKEVLHQVRGNKAYRAILLDGRWQLIQIEGSADFLQMSSLTGALSQSAQAELKEWVHIWLGLGDPLEGFYADLGADPLLGPLMQPLRGFRVGGLPDLFEALGWTVLGQQINLAFAYTLKARLVQTYGTQVSDPESGISCWGWPAADRIASLDPEVLRVHSISRAKARAIITVAQAITEGTLNRAELLGLGTAAAQEAKLCSLKGIGPWSAQYVMLRCLRQPEAFPAGDAGLQNNVKRLLALPQKPDAKALRQMATAWGPHKGLAAGYIWQAP